MLIYFVILFFIFIFSCLNPFIKSNTAATFTYWILCVVLIFFSGIRYDVGMDYVSYKILYEESVVLDEGQKEFVFAWIFHLCRIIGIPFQIIVMLFSFITVGLAFRFMKKYSPFVFFSIMLFFCFGQYYFNTFNAIRQTLVIYLFFNSLGWIEHRKWIPYFLSMAICIVAVHASAILLLPLYFLLHREYSFKIKTTILAFTFFSTPVIIYLVEASSYAIYLKFDQFAADVSASTYFLLILAILFFVVDTFREKGDLIKWTTILYNLNYISLLLLMLIFLFRGTPLIMVANRFSYYFTPVYLVLVPLGIAKLHRPNNRCILICVFTIIFGLISYMTICINGEANNLVPYKTIFNF